MTRYLLGLMLVLTIGLVACEPTPVDEVITPDGSVLEVPAIPDSPVLETPSVPEAPIIEIVPETAPPAPTPSGEVPATQPETTPLEDELGVPPPGTLTPTSPQ